MNVWGKSKVADPNESDDCFVREEISSQLRELIGEEHKIIKESADSETAWGKSASGTNFVFTRGDEYPEFGRKKFVAEMFKDRDV